MRGWMDQELLDRMALAMQIAALGRSARSTSGVKLRQPLARARVYAGKRAPDLGALADLVTDELNVKAIEFVDTGSRPGRVRDRPAAQRPGSQARQALSPPAQSRGGADAGALAARFQAGLSVTLDLGDGGPAVELLPEEVEVRTHGREGYAVAEEKGIIVAVDVTLTPELAREGLARDLVRRVQTLRKEADLQLDDRISTYYAGRRTERRRGRVGRLYPGRDPQPGTCTRPGA